MSQDTWVLLRTRRRTREKVSAHRGSRVIPARGLELRFRNSRLGMLDTILLIWKQDNDVCFYILSPFSYKFMFPFPPGSVVHFTYCEQTPRKDQNQQGIVSPTLQQPDCLWPSAPSPLVLKRRSKRKKDILFLVKTNICRIIHMQCTFLATGQCM